MNAIRGNSHIAAHRFGFVAILALGALLLPEQARSQTLGEAVDAPGLVWTTGGNGNWFGQATNTHDGVDAARSGAVGDYLSNWLETTVRGPGTLSFWWKVSSQTNGDYLQFSVEGVQKATLSGEVGWETRSYTVGEGLPPVRWTYTKNSSGTSGADAGWVDQVGFAPASGPPVITQQPQNQTVSSGSLAIFQVVADGVRPMAYQWQFNGTNLGGETTSGLLLRLVGDSQSGAYSVVLSNASGTAASSNAMLTVTHSAPVFTTQPQSQTNLTPGADIYLSAAMSGSWPMTFQWLWNGTNLPGATNRLLDMPSIWTNQVGAYQLVVGNSVGAVTSQVASLTFAGTLFPQPVGRWPRYREAQAVGVQVVGTLAYVADGDAGLQILDVSNPASVVRVGGYDTSGGAYDVQVVGNLAYVADSYAGLQVLDVSNPANVVRVGGYDTSGSAQGVQVVGNLAYVADFSAGLQVLDVSNPANVVRVGGYDTSGTAYGVQVVGNLAYVADGSAGLQILDVSNPANVVRVGGYDTSGSARGVQVVGNLAYVADDYAGLQVLDVSNPASVVQVGGYDTSGTAYGVQVVGNLAYVADGSAGLQILDVSNPANVMRVGGYDTSGFAWGVQVVGNLAYIADHDADLRILDVSNPANVVRVGGYDTSGGAYGVQVVGNLAYVADFSAGLQVLDVSNPASVVRVGGYDTSGTAYGVRMVGNLAYVADGSAGLQILNVSNPASVVRLGGYDTSGTAYGVQVVGNLAYVADGFAGLQILDVSNPASVLRMGGYYTNGSAYDVQVVGSLAYVADFSSGLQILDVSSPANAVRVGGYATSGLAWGVRVVGNLAYIADGDAGLQILDVSNPASVVRVGGYNTWYAYGVQVVGSLAYVADERAGLQILDVSNPASVVHVGGYDTSGRARGVQVVGNLAYMADEDGGLVILAWHSRTPQTITFAPLPDRLVSAPPFALAATASSGLPVSFRVISGPAVVTNAAVTLTGPGVVVIRAEQAGNETYASASADRSFQVFAPPVLTLEPVSRSVVPGTSVFFTAASTGWPAPSWQWRKDGTNLPGATQSSYTLPNVQLAHAGSYRVVASNYLGTATSSNAVLVVNTPSSPPVITHQPQSQTNLAGTSASFSVTATGTVPLAYQWRLNGTPIPGAAATNHVLASVQATNAGNYTVVITNIAGSATSAVATLTVLVPPTQIVAWGDDWYGQTNVPPGVSNVVGVAAGSRHSLAWRADGTLAMWGYLLPAMNAPPELSGVVSAAGGNWHTLALRSNGTVTAWGYNDSGQINVPAGISNAVAVAAGGNQSFVLRSDGAVAGWGMYEDRYVSLPASLSNVVAVAAGMLHWLALGADGTVSAGTYMSLPQTEVPRGLREVVAIAAGGHHSLALQADGNVVGWGANGSGQGASPSGVSNLVAVAAGDSHNLGLRTDGTVVAWGDNYYHQTGVPPGLSNVVAVAAGENFSLALVGYWPPQVTGRFTERTAVVGGFVRLLAQAVGAQPLAYQWQWHGTNLPGATQADYQIASAQMNHAGLYSVVLSNAYGSVTSTVSRLTVVVPEPPVIVAQPQDVTRYVGGSAEFRVTATGTEPLSYEWRWNGLFFGATQPTYFIENVRPGDAGQYSVVITNAYGSMTSRWATLLVTVPVVPRVLADSLAYSNGQFQFTFTGEPGKTFEIWASTNLPQFQLLLRLTNTTGLLPFTDPQMNLPRRFYQVREQP